MASLTTSSSSRLITALRLNNEGISLLLQNKDSAAVSHLTQALGMVKLALAEHPPSSEGVDAKSSLSLASSASSLPDLLHHHGICNIPGLFSNDCFIYNGAIVFANNNNNENDNNNDNDQTPSHEQQQEQEQEQDLTMNVYSACIILNIAMIYHRQGIVSSKNKKACLDKANVMYSMVSKLIGSDYDDHDDSLCGTALLVRLASLNNQSLIRLDQGDYDYSRSAFYHVSRMLNATREDQVLRLFGVSQDTVVVSPQQQQQGGQEAVQGMLLNAFLAHAPTAAAAA